jgi:hypothetical protein
VVEGVNDLLTPIGVERRKESIGGRHDARACRGLLSDG